MKKLERAIYMTADEIQSLASNREAEAMRMPPGSARQSILVEVAKLRAYANIKQWTASKPATARVKIDA